MPKFVEQIIENLLWTEISFENPDFLSGSKEEIPEVWHKTEAEIERDGHVW